MNTIDDPLYHKVSIVNRDEEDFSDIRNTISERKYKFHGMTLNKYSVVEGGLYYKDRLCVLEDLYIAVVQEVHDQPAYGHLGVARIYELVKREYY